MKMGAQILNTSTNTIRIRAFAHKRKNVKLMLKDKEQEFILPMREETPHVFSTTIKGLGRSPLYKFRIEKEGDFPDPYSNFQPYGVHGYSQVVDHYSYPWKDEHWKGIDLKDLIIYELHVGTFTPQGTFKGVINKLDYLTALGINAIEIMPVTQTPGRWNWGYDGSNLFSVNNNYGTPDDFKKLIDTCHQKGIAVILDVVYNHLGPEGNYLPVFGPYFTDKYETPWGPAVNFDDEFSFYTRKMVLDNVSYWLENFHLDGLRLDAVHAIKDRSFAHILQEINKKAKEISFKQGRKISIIAESDENDVTIINPLRKAGYGLDALWMDDFHHCIQTILTGEKEGYYIDYGRFSDLLKVYKNFIFTGEYFQYWGKPRGTDAYKNPGYQFVVCIQNHDQVGNRARGERLSQLVTFPFLKAAAGLMFFSPYIPLVFMGEEYAEKNPFLFFTDYTDPELKKKVSKGRMNEFQSFSGKDMPDPEDDNTFFASLLTSKESWEKSNFKMFNYYRDLIRLKKEHPAFYHKDKEKVKVYINNQHRVIIITRWNKGLLLKGLFNLGEETVIFRNTADREHRQILNSEWERYGGRSPEENNKELLKGNMIILEAKY